MNEFAEIRKIIQIIAKIVLVFKQKIILNNEEAK